jgi:hypothetical protein
MGVSRTVTGRSVKLTTFFRFPKRIYFVESIAIQLFCETIERANDFIALSVFYTIELIDVSFFKLRMLELELCRGYCESVILTLYGQFSGR